MVNSFDICICYLVFRFHEGDKISFDKLKAPQDTNRVYFSYQSLHFFFMNFDVFHQGMLQDFPPDKSVLRPFDSNNFNCIKKIHVNPVDH